MGESARACLVLVVLFSATQVYSDAPRGAHLDERLEAALAGPSAAVVVKITREIAEEIMKAPEGQARRLAVAIGLFRKAEALDPESLTADDAGRLGRMYLMLSESYADAAKRYLTRALERRERESDRVALGNALLYMGDAAGARREYLKVTETKPDESVVSVNLALAERVLGDTSSALARLRRIQARNANAAATRAASLSIADIEYALGNLSGAKSQVERILSTNPGDVEAAHVLEQINRKGDRRK
ncbi:hypothetical protein HY522_04515 [bacterium]|nr:hypothetical protein [bacterium]